MDTIGTADGQRWQQTQRCYAIEEARAEAERRAHAAGYGARAAFAYVVAFVHAAEDSISAASVLRCRRCSGPAVPTAYLGQHACGCWAHDRCDGTLMACTSEHRSAERPDRGQRISGPLDA